jgi:spermidine/putrescine transport system substrate-binding protein
MRHPRERHGPSEGMNRRDFLQGSLATVALGAAGLGGAGALLEACARSTTQSSQGARSLPLARPNHPVKWPIFSDNKPIASSLQPEKNATLQIYNWTAYIYKKVVNEFAAKYKCKVQVNTFNNMDEALAKIRSGQVNFDVFFPTNDVIGKLVEFKYVRPLNHSYIPNIKNVWPEFQNPFYDQGWRYTVPYVVYTTGIAWRVDKVSTDIAGMGNPYEIFWDPRHKGRVEILDDYREAMSMVLLKNGIYDVNTCDRSQLKMVQTQLLQMIRATKPRVTITDYSDLPAGKTWINQAWSGDMINAQYYMPKGQSPKVIRYWSQPAHAPINNDMMAILSSGKNPVLAHFFLNYMLDYHNAMENFSWVGYQPPQTRVNPSQLVEQGYIPRNLSTVTVSPSDFKTGTRELELSPGCDAAWHNVWSRFKSGG